MPSSLAGAVRTTTSNGDSLFTETNPTPDRGGGLSSPPPPKFRNDAGVAEICIGVREFKCIGVSPPRDHPHVYINMGEADSVLCPYCATRFRFDPRLTPLEADPPDSLFVDDLGK